MKAIRVLLTGVGAPGAPGIIKCIRKNGERVIKIIGVDMNASAGGKSLVDTFYTVPSADDEKFINRIKEICVQEKVDVIIPIVTKELLKFSRFKKEFERMTIKIGVMDEEILEIANNKAKLLTTLRDNNVATAKFRVAKNIQEFSDAIDELGFPEKAVVIKPAEGNGSRGVRIIDPSKSKFDIFFNEKPNSMYINYGELLEILSERNNIPEMIVMEYLPGKEYSVDVLADKGKVLQVMSRFNNYMVSSIALECTVERNEKLANLVSRITEILNLDGNFGFDVKYNTVEEPMVMEINPRLTAGIVAYAPAGINFPYLGIKKLLDEEISISEVQDGVKMKRRWEEIFYDSNDEIIKW